VRRGTDDHQTDRRPFSESRLTPVSADPDHRSGRAYRHLRRQRPNVVVATELGIMTEGIEIQFDRDEGHLRLDCSDEQFVQIRDLVISEASMCDRLGPFIDGIQSILVRRTTAIHNAKPARFRRGFQVFLAALGLGIALVVQVIGIIAIIWLLLVRHS
jgi:hypothetical protein